jgi:hypothetical protein
MPPESVRNLLLEAELRILAEKVGADNVRLEDGRVHFELQDPGTFRASFEDASVRPRIIQDDTGVLEIPSDREGARPLGLFLRDLLLDHTTGPSESPRSDTSSDLASI